MMEKICLQCKEVFYTSKKNKIFCDHRCAQKYNATKCNKEQMVKDCVICGNPFPTSKVKNIYCSKGCAGMVKKDYSMHRKITYFQIFKRDNFRCIYCDRSIFQNNIKLAIDHIVPRVILVDNNVTNLVTSCEECNKSKSDGLLSQEIIDEIKTEILRRTLEHKLEYAKLKNYFDTIYTK